MDIFVVYFSNLSFYSIISIYMKLFFNPPHLYKTANMMLYTIYMYIYI